MSGGDSERSTVHVPVMLREILGTLQLKNGLTVIDGTVGAAGHSRKILELISPDGLLIGFDRDPEMLARAESRLSGSRYRLIHAAYTEAKEHLAAAGVTQADRVLLDLGLSSDQLADRNRGFGFDAGGRLDMRFDTSTGISAAEWLNSASADELESVFQRFGEERYAARIAAEIVSCRSRSLISTAEELTDCIRRAVPTAGGRHPATRVFQAVRIRVNDELEHVASAVNHVLPAVLRPGGIAAILTFHSLEDRIVKQAFREDQGWQPLTKKPVEPSPAEVRINPRSRSARLRAARRL